MNLIPVEDNPEQGILRIQLKYEEIDVIAICEPNMDREINEGIYNWIPVRMIDGMDVYRRLSSVWKEGWQDSSKASSILIWTPNGSGCSGASFMYRIDWERETDDEGDRRHDVLRWWNAQILRGRDARQG